MAPEPYLAIDETLYPLRGRFAFKQYNKSKPAKYGILFRSMNAVIYPYTYCSIPYAGKPALTPVRPHHHISKADEWVIHLVKQIGLYAVKGCNITFDRFFTSLYVEEWLLQEAITSIGTVRSNAKGIKDLCSIDSTRATPSSKFYTLQDNEQITATSYMTKTKSGKKDVVVLSTHSQIYRTTDDEKAKPAIIKVYDYTKGGTDIVDQRIDPTVSKLNLEGGLLHHLRIYWILLV